MIEQTEATPAELIPHEETHLSLNQDTKSDINTFVSTLRPILEAILFAAAEPITVAALTQVLQSEGVDCNQQDVKQTLKAMQMGAASVSSTPATRIHDDTQEEKEDEKTANEKGWMLFEVDGGWVLRTNPTHARFVRRFLAGKPQKLSRAHLETLAIVAYKQPVTKSVIETIRGVDVGSALRALVDRKMIRVLGKADEIGRPLLYGTTKEFADFFNIKSIKDLPTLRELSELEQEEKSRQDGKRGVDDRDEDILSEGILGLVGKGEGPHAHSLVSKSTSDETDSALSDLDKALSLADETLRRHGRG